MNRTKGLFELFFVLALLTSFLNGGCENKEKVEKETSIIKRHPQVVFEPADGLKTEGKKEEKFTEKRTKDDEGKSEKELLPAIETKKFETDEMLDEVARKHKKFKKEVAEANRLASEIHKEADKNIQDLEKKLRKIDKEKEESEKLTTQYLKAKKDALQELNDFIDQVKEEIKEVNNEKLEKIVNKYIKQLNSKGNKKRREAVLALYATAGYTDDKNLERKIVKELTNTALGDSEKEMRSFTLGVLAKLLSLPESLIRPESKITIVNAIIQNLSTIPYIFQWGLLLELQKLNISKIPYEVRNKFKEFINQKTKETEDKIRKEGKSLLKGGH